MRFENPYLLTVLVQCIGSGTILLSKAVYDQGMDIFVFTFYRQLIGNLFMIPFARFFEWRSLLSLDFRTFWKIFGISFIGMRFENPYLLSVLVQCISSSTILLSKAVYGQGMNIFVFIFYRQLIGSLSMIPFAIFFEWTSLRSLDFHTFCKIFGISLIGVALTRNLFGFGLKLTSSTVSAAILNTVPVMTIAFAVILRMEKVDVRKRVGIAKVAGIALCIAGVALLAFYKGPYFKPSFLKHHHPLDLPNESHKTDRVHNNSSSKWLEGCLLSLLGLCAWSLGLVLQGKVLESYSSKLTFTTVLCTSSALQSLFVAIAAERDSSQWRLAFNFRLLVVIYCGTVATGVVYYLQACIIKSKGPVFLAMSMPLSLIITSICSMFLLGEAITLGSILGSLLLVGSLYSVLWAKKREEAQNNAVKDQTEPMPMEMQERKEEFIV